MVNLALDPGEAFDGIVESLCELSGDSLSKVCAHTSRVREFYLS